MQEILNQLAENSSFPAITALALGLMTAISPCPLATNITAIGYISKDVGQSRRVFMSGIIYTLGRAFTYTLLAFILFLGADQFKLSGWFQQYGERILGPLLIVMGVFMLGLIRINIPGFDLMGKRMENKERFGYWDSFLLGVVFALAFCPYSGVLYFMGLIPITITSASGLYLPVIFAIATGIPVIIFAWLLAYTVSGVGRFYNSIKAFEKWFRKIIAVLFIIVGVYYLWLIYF